jgi:hypothetical protein
VRGLPFNRIAEPPFFAVAPDGSAIAVAEWREEAPQSLVLRLVAPDGTERWRRELAVRPDPIQASEHDRLIAEAQELVHRARENLLQMGIRPHIAPTVPTVSEARNILYLPAYRPPVQAIRAGVDGTIWLLLGGGIDGATWLALDDDSDPFLTITLPPGATFGQATRNSLWYFEVDDMGVPYVVRARFSPSATGGLP